MSRQLVVNTQVDRSYPRSAKWQPSPETSAAIREEDDVPLATKQQHRTSTVYEEDEEEEEEEEEEDEEDELDEDDDSTFTSSPSIPDENINFDLVYALHTFVATVEGQASVVKGDALTLLDDSNSYWWLVSVLKTSEVGYIPAENIETPFERLARLNKHRNAELTSDDQAQHYIENTPRKKAAHGKKVTVNKDLSVQVQIILTGDDDDQEVGEAYEEYQEEMVTEDDENENKENNVQGQEHDIQADTAGSGGSSNNSGVEHPQEKSSVPLSQRNTTAPITLPPSAVDDEKKNGIWRLFSRNKKDNTRTSTEDTDSGSISSMASSVLSEDKTKPREPNRSTSNTSNLTVLRVFAGNINVGAMYHSLLVDENTSAEQLLVQAMGRFHIAQIEDKAAGRHSRTITPTGGSGVEYYLTVKAMNGDEITLAPQDKPLAIFQSLTDHLTTPMPSLTHIKQFSQQLSKVDNGKAGALKVRQRHKARLGEDSAIRFYLHKRIRRVNERAGLVYIKISLETDVADNQKPTTNQRSSGFSAKTLRRKKMPANDVPNASIQKLIAVSANICIAELLDTALEKFHITPNEGDHYRLSVVPANRRTEKVLGGNIKLIEVLHDDTPGSQADGEKLFILRKVGGGGSRSSSRESPRLYSSKVAPEQQRTHGSKTIARKKVDLKNLVPAAHPAAITVPIVDVKIEAALRRLDQALVSLVKRDKQDGPDQKNTIPAMAAARNSDQGVDIFMQRGILCSKPLSRNQIQYSLLAFVDGGNSKRQLVTQKVLQSNAIPSVSRGNVSEADMVTIVEYGKSFLEAQEKKNGRKGAATNGTPAFLLSSDILDSSGEQASSLEDLDKEFQRIIAAHAF